MIGIPYLARIPPVTRALAANDVLCRISAPATGVLLVTKAWLQQELANNINEVNNVGFVVLSTDGSGGAAMTFEENIGAAAAFPGTGAAIDADGWTAAPTVSGNPFEDRGFNLASGWEWAGNSEDEYIVVPPSARIGLILLRAPSSSMTWSGGLGLRYIGS